MARIASDTKPCRCRRGPQRHDPGRRPRRPRRCRCCRPRRSCRRRACRGRGRPSGRCRCPRSRSRGRRRRSRSRRRRCRCPGSRPVDPDVGREVGVGESIPVSITATTSPDPGAGVPASWRRCRRRSWSRTHCWGSPDRRASSDASMTGSTSAYSTPGRRSRRLDGVVEREVRRVQLEAVHEAEAELALPEDGGPGAGLGREHSRPAGTDQDPAPPRRRSGTVGDGGRPRADPARRRPIGAARDGDEAEGEGQPSAPSCPSDPATAPTEGRGAARGERSRLPPRDQK